MVSATVISVSTPPQIGGNKVEVSDTLHECHLLGICHRQYVLCGIILRCHIISGCQTPGCVTETGLCYICCRVKVSDTAARVAVSHRH